MTLTLFQYKYPNYLHEIRKGKVNWVTSYVETAF